MIAACPRCADLPEDVLRALRAYALAERRKVTAPAPRTAQAAPSPMGPSGERFCFGELTGWESGHVGPPALMEALTPRERYMLLALLMAHPEPAHWTALLPGEWDDDLGRNSARTLVARLRPKLVPYGVRVLAAMGWGYVLKEAT